MSIRGLVVLWLLATALVTGQSQSRAEGCELSSCVAAGDGGVTVGAETHGNAAGGSGEGAGRAKRYAYSYVPTCSTNAPGGAEDLCSAAILTCPEQGQQGIRTWVFRREIDASGQPVGPWELVRTVCVGSFTPTSPDQVRTLLLSDSRFIPAPVSRTRLNPASGRTVVHAEVVFSADTPASYAVVVPILGFNVALDLVPQSWEWHFGDGEVKVTSTAGRPYPNKDVVHRYRSKGAFAPYVTVTWGGTFTFNGVAYLINGTTTVDGPTNAIQVAQAKGQLVGGPNG